MKLKHPRPHLSGIPDIEQITVKARMWSCKRHFSSGYGEMGCHKCYYEPFARSMVAVYSEYRRLCSRASDMDSMSRFISWMEKEYVK